jgi:hypothetical protein
MSNSPDVEEVVWKAKQSEGGKEGVQPLFKVFTNAGEVEKWRKDKTIPMVDVVQGGAIEARTG